MGCPAITAAPASPAATPVPRGTHGISATSRCSASNSDSDQVETAP